MSTWRRIRPDQWMVGEHDTVFVITPDSDRSSQPESDAVNHPNHYGGDTVYESIKVIQAWGLGFCLGNTVKYISRAGRKDPSKTLEDLKKAEFYLQYEIRNLEGTT